MYRATSSSSLSLFFLLPLLPLLLFLPRSLVLPLYRSSYCSSRAVGTADFGEPVLNRFLRASFRHVPRDGECAPSRVTRESARGGHVNLGCTNVRARARVGLACTHARGCTVIFSARFDALMPRRIRGSRSFGWSSLRMSHRRNARLSVYTLYISLNTAHVRIIPP